MRTAFVLAALSALSAPDFAQASAAAKIRATYERLCTGNGVGSEAACAALRLEVEKAGVPGTVGWTGLMIGMADDGAKAVRVYAVDPNGPGGLAGIRTGDLLVSVDGQPFSDVPSLSKHLSALLARQAISVRVVRGDQILDLPLTTGEPPKPGPKLNSQRTDRGPSSLMQKLNGLNGLALTVDKVRVGENFYGLLEESDASSDWGKREECVELTDPGAKNLAAFVTPNGTPMRIYVMQGQCAYGVTGSSVAGADAKKPFGINFATQPGAKTFLMVSGASSGQPYHLVIREQTPKETMAWRDQIRQNQIAAQQQREAEERAAAERRQMWGAALQGLVIGATGAEMPAMRADGSRPNMLDTLNAANAALERKNAEGAARLNETIARAQAQVQRREQAAREEAEARANAQQQTQRIAQDRQAATVAFGNARAGIEQRLREAAAKGDGAQLAHWQQELKANNALAEQYGVTEEVRRHAQTKVAALQASGQGRLGQTPVGGFPAPIAPPAGQPNPTQMAQQQPGRGQVCYQGRVLGATNIPCDEAANGGGRPAGQGSTSGGGGGAGQRGSGGGGATSGGETPPRPPGGQPPRGSAQVEYVQRQEGVTLCELTGPQAQFKNWRCTGPLQMNYVNFEKPNWTSAMLMTCGGKGPVRDLGTAGSYRAFGCGHAIDQAFHTDVPARFGVSYVPGRISYRCRKDRTSCVQ